MAPGFSLPRSTHDQLHQRQRDLRCLQVDAIAKRHFAKQEQMARDTARSREALREALAQSR